MREGGSTGRRTLHEAAHKVGVKPAPETDGKIRTGRRPVQKRSFHEAAHKLGYFKPPPSAAKERDAAVRRRFEALADTQRAIMQ